MIPRTKRETCMLAVAAVLLVAAPLPAATWYVDYDAGKDTASGQSPDAAFKHCPGDPAATGAAKAAKLQPGDTVLFRGGVVYRGSVTVTASGSAGKPIVFDGNAGTFGAGPAIIEGADPVSDWKRCASADEAKGNPRWASIYHADIPKPANWRNINLCDDEKSLPLAQEPNPKDPMFQENPGEYYLVDAPLELHCPLKVAPEPGTNVNSARPLIHVVAPGNDSAVISPVAGGGFSVELDKPASVTAVGLEMVPTYTAAKDVVFLGDGKELLKATLAKGKAGMQKFELSAPVSLSKLTVKFLSVYDANDRDYTAIRQVGAFTADGANLLQRPAGRAVVDPKNLTQTDPNYYAGMTFAFHGGNNIVLYLPVEGYDPAAHRLRLGFYGGGTYKQTRYSLLNSVRLIDVPGEYSVEPTADAKVWRIYLLPEKVEGGAPAGIGMARRGNGFLLQGASHVVVQGFRIRRQGNASRVAGLHAAGPASNVTFRDCEVSLVRGDTGVSATRVDHVLVERCHIHHNPGHTKGIVLHTCTDAVTRDCRLVKNTSTGLDYYGCTDGLVAGNIVTDHLGMHANGLTFYLGCKNIVVERNRVSRGHCALTFQEGENLFFRNNVLDGSGRSMVVGIWPGQPLKNVQIVHNTIVRSDPNVDWKVGLFTNSKKIDGLIVRNNIIDGLSGGETFRPGVFSHNLYTRLGPDRKADQLAEGERYEGDLGKVFVDPARDDFRLRPGSPAIAAGAAGVGVANDIDGSPRPQGAAPDVGAYQSAATPAR